MKNEIITFLRRKDYSFIDELGEGATGKTILIHDTQIEENFVCKKFKPCIDERKEELFQNFVREIKLLHKIFHRNVVRIFNYYLYPEHFSGYILMEYIRGQDIHEFLRANPEKINDVFSQVISGFACLEENSILHRDIRPPNILVSQNGLVKIIDLGFGKQVQSNADFNKSISLQSWCRSPSEYAQEKYDFKTEIYFVGKLFEEIMNPEFRYEAILKRMCNFLCELRCESFKKIEMEIQAAKFSQVEFSLEEQTAYRAFANVLEKHVSKIKNGAKYYTDFSNIVKSIESIYSKFMLEEFLPDSGAITALFINGTHYKITAGFPVSALKYFLSVFSQLSNKKSEVLLANLQTRLDNKPRYEEQEKTDYSEVPF